MEDHVELKSKDQFAKTSQTIALAQYLLLILIGDIKMIL